MKALRGVWLNMVILAAGSAYAQLSEPGAHGPSQVAADMIMEFAGTQGAFLASGMMKANFDRDDLSTLVQFPDDEIVIVTLKGSEIRQAFERSISLHPQYNASFLQIAGFEVGYTTDSPVGQRIKSVTVAGAKLDDGKEYTIAMPSSLGRGGYGFFRIWDRNKITKTLETTVGKVLAGKKATESRSRWIVQP